MENDDAVGALDEALDHLLDWLDQRYILHYSQELHRARRGLYWETEKQEFRQLVKAVLIAKQ